MSMLYGDHARLVEAALPVCAAYGLAIAGGYAVKAHGRYGPVIALADAVALKMGALHDRGLPRDLLDVRGAAVHFTAPDIAEARALVRRGTERGSG